MTEERDPQDGRVTSEREGCVLLMRIERERKLNGFTPNMFADLAGAFTTLEADDGLRVGLVLPAGPHFSAGLDLPRFAPLMQRGEPAVPDGLVDPFDLREPRRTKPIVLGLRGISFTLAVELALAADVAIAADDARLSQIEVQRAIMATGGATVRLVERAGWGNAMRWLLTGEEFCAAEALRLGVVCEVVPPDRLEERARTIANAIAAAAPLAVRATRRNALAALERSRDAAYADFARVQRSLARSEDAAEGLAAFREKRAPTFRGR